MTKEKVVCRTPTKGKAGTTSIPKWKYDCVKRAIWRSVGEDGLAFKNLVAAVKTHLTDDELSRLGSVGWHVTTVKLNMEVDGEIYRAAGLTPQYLKRQT